MKKAMICLLAIILVAMPMMGCTAKVKETIADLEAEIEDIKQDMDDLEDENEELKEVIKDYEARPTVTPTPEPTPEPTPMPAIVGNLGITDTGFHGMFMFMMMMLRYDGDAHEAIKAIPSIEGPDLIVKDCEAYPGHKDYSYTYEHVSFHFTVDTDKNMTALYLDGYDLHASDDNLVVFAAFYTSMLRALHVTTDLEEIKELEDALLLTESTEGIVVYNGMVHYYQINMEQDVFKLVVTPDHG